MNMLGLAKRVKARFLLASTSGACLLSPIKRACLIRDVEVYGSPEEHPQKGLLSVSASAVAGVKLMTKLETYWGHVNPIGPRACYDEGKRVAESLTYGYHRQDAVDVRIARIFNTCV